MWALSIELARLNPDGPTPHTEDDRPPHRSSIIDGWLQGGWGALNAQPGLVSVHGQTFRPPLSVLHALGAWCASFCFWRVLRGVWSYVSSLKVFVISFILKATTPDGKEISLQISKMYGQATSST